jgi:uncharacterized protein YraI
MIRPLLAIFAVAAIGFGSAARAGSAYSQGFVHLRAGPSAEYPLVFTLLGMGEKTTGCIGRRHPAVRGLRLGRSRRRGSLPVESGCVPG